MELIEKKTICRKIWSSNEMNNEIFSGWIEILLPFVWYLFSHLEFNRWNKHFNKRTFNYACSCSMLMIHINIVWIRISNWKFGFKRRFECDQQQSTATKEENVRLVNYTYGLSKIICTHVTRFCAPFNAIKANLWISVCQMSFVIIFYRAFIQQWCGTV